MAVKNDIDITIDGKTITLSGVESEEYLREVASYLNGKIREYMDDAAYWRLPNDMRNVMLQLNLADDFFKEHSQVIALQAQVQDLEAQRDRMLLQFEEQQGAAQEAASRIGALEKDAEDLREKVQRASAAENSATKRFGAEKSRVEKLTEEMDALRRSKAEADKAVQRLRQELADTRDSLQSELDRVRKDLEGKLSASESRRKNEVQELQSLRQKEVQELQSLRQKEVKELQELRQKEVTELRQQRQKEVTELQTQHQKEIKSAEEQHRREIKSALEQHQKEMKTAEEQHQSTLTSTREDLSRRLKAAETASAEKSEALKKAAEEIKGLREQCAIATRNEDSAKKKLTALEKSFDEKLAADTQVFRTRAQDANEELEKVKEELVDLQEQENARLQAASKARAAMQELVQQYGRFGQSLDEAAELMRTMQ